MSHAARPAADVPAEILHWRRQLILAGVAFAVVVAVTAAIAVTAALGRSGTELRLVEVAGRTSLAPAATGHRALTVVVAAGLAAVLAVFVVLLRHTFAVATYTFRRQED